MKTSKITDSQIMSILKQAESGTLVATLWREHGMSNAILGRKYHWNYQWEQEMAAMCSNRIHLFIKQHNIELINYGDL